MPPDPPTGACKPGTRCINDGPPHQWSAATRAGLANTILTEYGNSHDAWDSAMSNLDALIQLRPSPDWNGPGFFSDGDMLQTWNFGMGKTGKLPGMSQSEYTAQFALYAVLASQLVISADVRTLQRDNPECLALLLNQDLLAVNQDVAAKAPRVILSNASGTPARTVAQCFFQWRYRRGVAQPRRGHSGALGELGAARAPATASCKVRDLISSTDLGAMTGAYSASVGAHQAAAVRVSCTSGAA